MLNRSLFTSFSIAQRQIAEHKTSSFISMFVEALHCKLVAHVKCFCVAGPVLMALHPSALHDSRQHHNKMTAFLLDHSPEVTDSVGQRALSCNVSVDRSIWNLHVDIVRVDIIAVFLVHQNYSSAVV